MRGHERSDDIVADFCDSKHAVSHPLWSADSHALQIFLYFDELELCNPLGASRKIHKLGQAYNGEGSEPSWDSFWGVGGGGGPLHGFIIIMGVFLLDVIKARLNLCFHSC